MTDKKKPNSFSFKDKGAPPTAVQVNKRQQQSQTQHWADKPKSPPPSLGSGLAEQAKQAIINRKKQIDKASK